MWVALSLAAGGCEPASTSTIAGGSFVSQLVSVVFGPSPKEFDGWLNRREHAPSWLPQCVLITGAQNILRAMIGSGASIEKAPTVGSVNGLKARPPPMASIAKTTKQVMEATRGLGLLEQ